MEQRSWETLLQCGFVVLVKELCIIETSVQKRPPDLQDNINAFLFAFNLKYELKVFLISNLICIQKKKKK